jgi:beta-phosphoglucomutase-like phosphatase (HAD superfamily)
VATRGLLFDFDGLLVDTETPARLAYEELYREHGHELPLDKWATLVGTIGAEFDPDSHLEELVGRPLDQVALAERRRAREFELCDLEDFRPGIEDYLAGAERRGLKTAIVSSSNTEWIERHLRRLDRANGWDLIVAADGDVARAKPQPDLYAEALEELGLRPSEAIAFEDSVNGIRAARGAGVFVVAVPNPITETFALEEADLMLPSLEDLALDELIERVDAGR